MHLPSLSLFLIPLAIAAAEPQPAIAITLDRGNALYHCGEQATFSISTAAQTGRTIEVALYRDQSAELVRERFSADGKAHAIGGTLDQPGFIHCVATLAAATPSDGKPETARMGAGFDPERIRPSRPRPDDFAAFWQTARKERDAIPADPRLTVVREDPAKTIYKLSVANIGDTRAWAYLLVPKRPGPFPLWITLPGANFNAPTPPGGVECALCDRGAITMVMSAHAHEMGNDAERDAAAKRYGDYPRYGLPDPTRYYYRRAILGADRLIDYACSRPDWDGKHCVYSGHSQGGAFGLFMAGLNPHLTACCVLMPALCDQDGLAHGRKPGWPWAVRAGETAHAAAMNYFDGASFAADIRIPLLACVGFADEACPPTSVYSALNAITGPKRAICGPDIGHWPPPRDFAEFEKRWIDGELGFAPRIASFEAPPHP